MNKKTSSENETLEKYSWGEVITLDDFMWPAGTILVIVIGGLLFNSPFAWVLVFAYFLLFLPLLAIWIRQHRRPEVFSEPVADNEPEAGAKVRAALEMLTNSTNLDENLVARALAEYRTLEVARLQLSTKLAHLAAEDDDDDDEDFEEEDELAGKSQVRIQEDEEDDDEEEEELPSPRRRLKKAADGAYAALLKNLHSCSVLLAKVDAIEMQTLMRNLQTLRPSRELDEYKEIADKREKMISQAIDRLRAGDQRLARYTVAAAVDKDIETQIRQLEELADKPTKKSS